MTNSKALDRAAILAVPPALETFDMPEWGGAVQLRRLTLGDTVRLAAVPNEDYAAALVVASVVDPAGNPIFSADDVPAIKNKPAMEINRLVKRLSAMNGLGGTEKAAIEGNSEASPSGG